MQHQLGLLQEPQDVGLMDVQQGMDASAGTKVMDNLGHVWVKLNYGPFLDEFAAYARLLDGYVESAPILWDRSGHFIRQVQI